MGDMSLEMSMETSVDEDARFKELLQELGRHHENELRTMREAISKLQMNNLWSVAVQGPSGNMVSLLPKQTLRPRLESSERVPELKVELDLPTFSEVASDDLVPTGILIDPVGMSLERGEDEERSDGRSSGRKSTTELAREACKALMMGHAPVAKGEDDESPSRVASFYSKKSGLSSKDSKGTGTSHSAPKKKMSEKEKFATKQESLDPKSAVDLSAELPTDASWARYLVSDRYELILGSILLFSVFFLAADFQFSGYVIGREIAFKDMASLPPGEENPAWITYATLTLDIFFGIEVAMRVAVLRLVFFKLWVNWLDFIIVFAALTVDIVGGMNAGFNVGVVRLLRLAKIARALRVVRMRRALESLSLLLRCVQSSLQVLIWSLGLLSVIQCIAGMVISQLLVPYMRNPDIDVDRRHEVYKYFGTFTRTFLTMFEVLFANWAIPARICVENVGEIFIYIFIFYRCLVGYAVLNVVSAVFVQQTMKVAQQDQEYMMNLKQKQAEAYAQKLKRFFMTLDASGDGLVSWEEFSVLLHDPQLQIWMSTLDLETHDLVNLFQMIDDGDGEISVDEFIDGATRLRGMARSLDVAQVLTSIKKVELKIEDLKGLFALAGKRNSTSRKSADKGTASGSTTRAGGSQLVSTEVKSQMLTAMASASDPAGPVTPRSSIAEGKSPMT